ncbi:hypothetical protein CYMTET_15106, partial [Cymbomonas tetramitiformis]
YVSVFKVLIHNIGKDGWFQQSRMWNLIFLQRANGSFELSQHLATVLRAGEAQEDLMSKPVMTYYLAPLKESIPEQLLGMCQHDDEGGVTAAEEVWATILVLQELTNLPYTWIENPKAPPHSQVTLRSRSEMFLDYQCELHPALTGMMPELKATAVMLIDQWEKSDLLPGVCSPAR